MKRNRRRAVILATGFPKKQRRAGTLRKRPKLVLLTGVLICGLLLGAIALRSTDASLQELFRDVLENELQTAQGAPLWKNCYTDHRLWLWQR